MPVRAGVSAADKGVEYLYSDLGLPAGAYRVSALSGLITGAGANGEVFHLRNPSATVILVVESVVFRAQLTTAYTTPQENGMQLFRATGWSVDGTGGTALAGLSKYTPLASVVASGNARIANAAALGAGTKNIDAQQLGSAPMYDGNTVLTSGLPSPLGDLTDLGAPVVMLGQNEGILLRQPVAMGAVGVHRLHVTVDYREIPAS